MNYDDQLILSYCIQTYVETAVLGESRPVSEGTMLNQSALLSEYVISLSLLRCAAAVTDDDGVRR